MSHSLATDENLCPVAASATNVEERDADPWGRHHAYLASGAARPVSALIWRRCLSDRLRGRQTSPRCWQR
jgi:hypothetical protein